MKLRDCSVLNIKRYVKNVITAIYAVDVVWHQKNRMIIGVFSLKAVLNYVLFYYDSKANRRKNLEIYIAYMEEVKRRWEEESNEEEKRAI